MSGIEAPEGEDHDGRAPGKIARSHLLLCSAGALQAESGRLRGKRTKGTKEPRKNPAQDHCRRATGTRYIGEFLGYSPNIILLGFRAFPIGLKYNLSENPYFPPSTGAPRPRANTTRSLAKRLASAAPASMNVSPCCTIHEELARTGDRTRLLRFVWQWIPLTTTRVLMRKDWISELPLLQ